MSEKASKGRFLGPDKNQKNANEGKGKEKKKERRGRKEVDLAVTFSKIRLDIDYNNSSGRFGHYVQESWPCLSNVTPSPYGLNHVKNEISPVEFREFAT